ncbi:chemotaxis protein CheB [Erythrobacter sp. LQ02-29]|uniref:chemotaxis protein CheB n=1 Tax=unclassified Erythrobacter TaxID=2633097 RepID=UPI001BFC32C6|nr:MULTISPECIES: chemotaxis protein CheB [unclassified Erythrobacter]MCP9223637.1 chemotaxis protein CheB [Erythrobacter sp. LQ02-29]QWC57687.1 chemotaxis protein CheB [Erythrobacter sp. 3-20A1M]
MSLEAVVIGASAGGVQALSQVLPALPKDFPAPVLVVVHIPPRRENALVDLFAGKCRLRVKEAEDKEPLAPGTIYFAPPDYHLLVETDGTIALSSDEPVNHSRPAIDVLFESAADAFGAGLAGIVMTGANSDGAQGLRAVCAAAGLGIVQDPETAEVATMPMAARAACPGSRTMLLEDMGPVLEAMIAR